MLGLRLPSALFGILAIALAYGFGRELLGRSGGAVLAVLVATIPEVVHLAQFARGYTAMLAASFGSMWLLLLLVRTRRARYVAPYAVSALCSWPRTPSACSPWRRRWCCWWCWAWRRCGTAGARSGAT
jgi:uncharacterized membrane protein